MPTEVDVLRLGHRPQRDKRLTTHVGLTARALGAERMHLAAEDDRVKESVEDVAERWGGDFVVETGANWRALVRNWGGAVVHLTMKGENILDVEEEIKGHEEVLVVVGAEKVPSEMYDESDFNVAVTSQPHSEVAALAVFLDRILEGAALEENYDGESFFGT